MRACRFKLRICSVTDEAWIGMALPSVGVVKAATCCPASQDIAKKHATAKCSRARIDPDPVQPASCFVSP